MTGPGGQGARPGRPRWAALSRAETARASQVLARLDELVGRQRTAIARLAAAELAQIGLDQAELEGELHSILVRAGAGDGAAGDPASAAERAHLAATSARVRRACQHNMALLAHARRSVNLLLGIDEERAGYDRRARRLTAPHSARSRAL
jgi:hypothetical protein